MVPECADGWKTVLPLVAVLAPSRYRSVPCLHMYPSDRCYHHSHFPIGSARALHSLHSPHHDQGIVVKVPVEACYGSPAAQERNHTQLCTIFAKMEIAGVGTVVYGQSGDSPVQEMPWSQNFNRIRALSRISVMYRGPTCLHRYFWPSGLVFQYKSLISVHPFLSMRRAAIK